jgi:hypothetical protein
VFFLVTRQGLDNHLSDARGPLCVHPNRSFTFINENQGSSACERAGGRWVKFKWFDTASQPNYTLNFRSAGQCNLMDG